LCGWVWGGLTSDITGAVGEFLNFFFCEDAKDDDEVLTLFEALVGFLQSFGIDEAAVDLGPAGTWWDAFLMRLQDVSLAMS
jgi:hypothetical protein